jgi:hypothetical protein
MDLSKLNTTAACDMGATIELRHPVTNVPLGATITILGKDSTVFKQASREATNARIRREAMAARRGKEAEVRTVEDIERENIDLLARCTTGWTGIVDNGVEIPFTFEAAKKLYRDYSWVYDQVNEGVGDLENFIPS